MSTPTAGLDTSIDESFYIDFANLHLLTTAELIRELIDTAVNLARYSEGIGFLRAEEARNPQSYAKSERVQIEGIRAVYEEKKWVIIRLLELARIGA